jgi:hypothetical protein
MIYVMGILLVMAGYTVSGCIMGEYYQGIIPVEKRPIHNQLGMNIIATLAAALIFAGLFMCFSLGIDYTFVLSMGILVIGGRFIYPLTLNIPFIYEIDKKVGDLCGVRPIRFI